MGPRDGNILLPTEVKIIFTHSFCPVSVIPKTLVPWQADELECLKFPWYEAFQQSLISPDATKQVYCFGGQPIYTIKAGPDEWDGWLNQNKKPLSASLASIEPPLCDSNKLKTNAKDRST